MGIFSHIAKWEKIPIGKISHGKIYKLEYRYNLTILVKVYVHWIYFINNFSEISNFKIKSKNPMGFFPILQNGKKIPWEKLNLWIEPYNFFSAICMTLSKDWRLKTHI